MVEVGPRDGLQIITEFVPTERKIELVNALMAAGIRRVEVTSFVHPKFVLQLRDAAEVLAGIERVAGVSYVALTPGLRGAQKALEARPDEITYFIAASEAQNQQLLASMDKRADLQLRLQRTVEGLSVVAISYYAVNLLSYLLSPVAPVGKTTLTGALVLPVVLLVWLAVRKIRQHTE